MTDPMQTMAQPNYETYLYPQSSRYYGIDTATMESREGKTLVYLRRRFIPQPESFELLQEHTVVQGDRLDIIAAHYLGDPLIFWRICDANRTMRPEELTETIGRKIRITMPEAMTGINYG
jgi:hypothetical protein